MSLVLKAEFNGEIRRVGLDKNDATIEKLETKLRVLFPQLGDSFLLTCSSGDFHSDADVARAFAEAEASKPPLVRIRVDPSQTRKMPVEAPVVVEAEYIHIPSPAENETSFGDWTRISEPEASVHKCSICSCAMADVHYKCLNCLDVEICPQCEEAQLHHDATHLFVKMRCPVSSLPFKRQLIFKTHIDNPAEREQAKEERKKLREQENKKREVREAERKKRAQEKLKRVQALKEKASNKKAKLAAAAEKKKKQAALAKVKRAKKVVAEKCQAEDDVPESCAPIAPEQPAVVEVPTTEEETKTGQEFSLLRFLSEFHILKEVSTKEEEVKAEEKQPEAEEEQKVEIELQVLNEEEPLQTEEQVVAQKEEEVNQPEEVTNRQQKEDTQFARNLRVLEEMGFNDREKNVELLVRNVGDLEQTIHQLLNPQPLAAISRWLPFTIGL